MIDFKCIHVLILANLLADFIQVEFFIIKSDLNFLCILRPNWHSSSLLTTTQSLLYIKKYMNQEPRPRRLCGSLAWKI